MIQRIQTVFLFLVAVLGIVIFFFPIATYYSDISFFKFFLCSVRDYAPDPFNEMATTDEKANWLYPLALSILQLIIVLISLVTIFKFKKRMLQVRLNYLNIFLTVLLVGGIFYFSTILEELFNTQAQYGLGGVFPLISIILLFLANIYIKKDERLVRSADRLR
jgi:hypothetical protein